MHFLKRFWKNIWCVFAFPLWKAYHYPHLFSPVRGWR